MTAKRHRPEWLHDGFVKTAQCWNLPNNNYTECVIYESELTLKRADDSELSSPNTVRSNRTVMVSCVIFGFGTQLCFLALKYFYKPREETRFARTTDGQRYHRCQISLASYRGWWRATLIVQKIQKQTERSNKITDVIHVLRGERGCCERYVCVVQYASELLTSVSRTLGHRTRTGASGARCAATDENTSSFSRGIVYILDISNLNCRLVSFYSKTKMCIIWIKTFNLQQRTVSGYCILRGTA